MKPRVVLADDNEAILKLVSRLLRSNFKIVGAARNGREAMSIALRLQPDVLVLDLSMPVLGGLQVAELLAQRELRCKVVFLTALSDSDLVNAALSAGVQGFVLKSRMYSDLVRAIDAVLAGQTFISVTEQCD